MKIDQIFRKALVLAKDRKLSTAYIQRKFCIDFKKAKRIYFKIYGDKLEVNI